MMASGDRDRAWFGDDPDCARFWQRWDRAMQVVGLIFVLLGALGLAVEAFGADLPVRIPSVVSGIVLVLGLLVLTTSWRNENEP